MSYVRAEDYFNDNRQHLSPATNPALRNLSLGLAELTRALQTDSGQVRALLEWITQLLARQRRAD